ncbi:MULTISPECIES: hypothetical protein [Neisseria]|uniref:Uncharacterized protein n=1 Tax=Neisseria canis TaxID=493 RepID=A0A448D7J0_9NEIS|nr:MULTISPECIES: hypothetical protein [Neisseria]OSI12268.1 hypothetical protein BWD07_06105 [Neisseria canis]OSI12825.1 hypothetical protein BV914_11970 [Neisseria dumasiana]VEF00727.1 Uncharacterised protein [Neisseria canis]
MTYQYIDKNQEIVCEKQLLDAAGSSADDVQGASMSWDIMGGNGPISQTYFGDFFPMQAAG